MSEPIFVLDEALARLDAAAPGLFHADPTTRSVGLERLPDGAYGLLVTQCGDVIRPLRAARWPLPAEVGGLPVRRRTAARSPAVLSRLPGQLAAPTTVQPVAPVRERDRQRPLPWGAEVQNFDADQRGGHLEDGGCFVGTLGCVVRQRDGAFALLSNNHVLADENHGRTGQDRVLQCSAAFYSPGLEVARLGAYVPIVPWHGAGTVPPAQAMNRVDAALAPLGDAIHWQAGYLAEHGLLPARTVGFAMQGDRVHKVGRTTGATTGVVTQIGITVGPLSYLDGPSFFQRIFAIEGDQGQPFALHGDSGGAVVRSDGALVGLVFAGDDLVTYACDAGSVFSALGCALV